MPVELFADSAATTLTSSPGIGATSFTVASSAAFPAASSAAVPPTRFRVLLGSEMVTVTNVAGLTWTVLPTVAVHTSADAVTHVVFAASLGGLQYPQSPLRPDGADYETFPRAWVSDTGVGKQTANQVLYLTAISLPKGLAVGHIAFEFISPNSGGAIDWWYELIDANRVVLACTAGQVSATQGANSVVSLAVATTAVGAATSFTTTYAGLYYIGIATKDGASQPLLACGVGRAGMNSRPPILAGASSTALSSPPAFPSTRAAITAAAESLYGWVGA